jgi:capsule polysaccharide export protein KpsE/RkpR
MKTSTSGEAYSYIVILNSRTVIDSMIRKYELHKVYDIKKYKQKKLREEFLSNVEITFEKEGNYTITVWDTDKRRAANIANDYVQIANTHFVNIFRQDNLLSKKYFEERISTLDSSIKYYGELLKRFSQKTLLFAPEEQAKSIAQSISEIKSEQIKYDILSEYYSKNYGELDPVASLNKKLSQEFAGKLQTIQQKPGFAGNFSLTNATDVQVEYLKIYTEFETYSKVKAFLLPTIEKIKSDEIKQIQNLLIVDPAVPPDSKDKPKRVYIVAGSTFGAFIIGIMLIFIMNYFKELKMTLKEMKTVGSTE